jgi:integrase
VQFFIELKLRSGHSGDEAPVFASKEGTPLGHRNVSRRGFEPSVARAGIDGVTFHDMRHAFEPDDRPQDRTGHEREADGR